MGRWVAVLLVLVFSLTACLTSSAPAVSLPREAHPAAPSASEAPVDTRPVDTRPAAPTDGSGEAADFAAMTAALHRMVSDSAGLASLESIAKTHEGRDVWVLRLAAPGEVPIEDRQAILIVAGIDAEHRVGSQVAIEMAGRLLSAAGSAPHGPEATLLRKRVLYVVPRVNADGMEAALRSPHAPRRVNARPVDEDRDGRVDEDGPDDLNRDGVISVMRVPHPLGEWMIDPDEPRLLKKADPSRGQRGRYRIMLEGLDNDQDGQINEDGPGGVDDDCNWPHFYQPGRPEHGLHQLSEPQTRALAEFVLGHPRISAALVYGRHDNIVRVPRGEQRGPEGRSWRDLHREDVRLYEHLGEKFKAVTGLEESSGCNPEGAFYAWLYSQQGILTLATNVWWPVERVAPSATQPATQLATAPATAPGTPPDPEEDSPSAGPSAPRVSQAAPTRVQRGAGQGPPERTEPAPTRRGQRRTGPAPPGGAERGGTPGRGPRRAGGRPPAPRDGEEARPLADTSAADLAAAMTESTDTLKAWLRYSDQRRGGSGFVPWAPYAHPTLGAVEIGGLVAGFTAAAPPEDVQQAAQRQLQWLLELSGMLPAVQFGKPRVRGQGADVWQVELRLINDGLLPTHLAMARELRRPGLLVRPRIEPQRLLGGRPVERVEYLEGSGGAAVVRFLVRGAEGSTASFVASSQVYGELTLSLELRETPPGQQEDGP